jgi:nitrile hydratase subunit beta
MNGAQDMGGKHGFGPVKPELNEPVFHNEWEKRAFALTLAMGMPGGWNIEMSRFARENRPPAEYLSMSYYQIWFAALEHMAKEQRAGVGR